MHSVLATCELINRILLNLTRPRDILQVALVSRMFSLVALRILWQNYQHNLGPLLRCVPPQGALAIVGFVVYNMLA